MNLLKIIIASLAVFSASAGAYWVTEAKDDLFTGKKTVYMAGNLSTSDSFIALDCEDKKLYFSYLEKTEPKKMESLLNKKGMILLKVDNNEVRKAEGVWVQRNDKTIALKTDNDEFVIDALRDLMNSKKTLSLGVSIGLNNEKSITLTGNVSGTTKAARKFVTECPALKFS